MTLSLDPAQRLNVHVLLGLLECTSLYETRLVWKMMDRLMLDNDEKAAIGFQMQGMNGTEAYTWDQTKSIPLRDFDLSEPETKQIQRALEPYLKKWKIPVRARPWLEPLLAQLPEEWVDGLIMEPAETNGVPAR